ncbi:hypothetical protein OAO18_02720 [Francisellaceae bacterium]|nr:hypothetical protein [Francisellaceae bacterium]
MKIILGLGIAFIISASSFADIYSLPENEKIKYNEKNHSKKLVEEEQITTQTVITKRSKNNKEVIEKETISETAIKKEIVNDKFLKASKSISF